MHSTKIFRNTVLVNVLFLVSGWALAAEGHPQQPIKEKASKMDEMAEMDHTQHPQTSVKSTQEIQHTVSDHADDHLKEHGAQTYVVTTLDHQWFVKENGDAALISEIETRIGTDENKVFFKAHINKQESKDAEYSVKALYSRMISDFWDVQMGAQYRNEKLQFDYQPTDTEEKVDAVVGLHGLAPYFFETDAYLYVGENNYTALSLETNRDLLLTQKFILQPYLDLNIIFSDDSKYAQKSGMNNLSSGLKLRYEVNKQIMPYVDLAYTYSKGRQETEWQPETESTKGLGYGVGVKFLF